MNEIYRSYTKRVIDVTIAIIGLFAVSPLLLLVYFVLKINLKGSPVFLQLRPGKDGIGFKLIKFKTMTDEKDSNGNLLPDMERITKTGNIIRKLSIDELPQLINVLKGDMSLVGPRPLLFRYMHLYSDEQMRRHSVRPGITGWAQVKGRNKISWKEKFAYDIYYVDNLSFLFDLKILWLTGMKVIKMDGVNQSDARPMRPFDGTN